MTTLREAAQMALDALEQIHRDNMTTIAEENWSKAIEALRAALAQPEQEPINYEEWNYDPMTGKPLWGEQPEQEPPCKTGSQCVGNKCERCAVQPEREWVGLTDEERQECLYSDPIFGMAASTFARAIEAKLKEKNGL
jgi:hypothetical protein